MPAARSDKFLPAAHLHSVRRTIRDLLANADIGEEQVLS